MKRGEWIIKGPCLNYNPSTRALSAFPWNFDCFNPVELAFLGSGSNHNQYSNPYPISTQTKLNQGYISGSDSITGLCKISQIRAIHALPVPFALFIIPSFNIISLCVTKCRGKGQNVEPEVINFENFENSRLERPEYIIEY